MRRISLTGSTHSPVIFCFRTMAANVLRIEAPSRLDFRSSPSAACGSDCGRARSCAPRSGETMRTVSRNRMSPSQESSEFSGVVLTKSRASRPPSIRICDEEKEEDTTLASKDVGEKQTAAMITSKRYHNGYGKRTLTGGKAR